MNAIDVDVAHRLASSADLHDVGDGDSFFNQGIIKWRELNCTADFTAFLAETRAHIQTFNQVVYHRVDLVNALIRHLQKKDTMAYEPLLE